MMLSVFRSIKSVKSVQQRQSLPKLYPKQHPSSLRDDQNSRPMGPIWGRPPAYDNLPGTVPPKLFLSNTELMVKKKMQNETITQPNQHMIRAAFVGPTNTGKTSLINELAGFVSATSRKSKTTYENVEAIYSFAREEEGLLKNVQAVLTDTPGTFLVNRSLRSTGWRVVSEVQVVFLVLDGCKRYDLATKLATQRLGFHRNQNQMKTFLVINKLDKADPRRLTDLVREAEADCKFQGTLLTSLQARRGLDQIQQKLAQFSLRQAWNYTKDMTTTGSQGQLYIQLLEEALSTRLHRDIPYRLELQLTGYAVRQSDGLLKLEYLIRAPTEQIAAMVLGYRGRNIGHYVDHIRRHLAKKDRLVQVGLVVSLQKKKLQKINERIMQLEQKQSKRKVEIQRKNRIEDERLSNKVKWIA